jgi:RNA polymerase sigma-70 factor (ECF subfamily)
VSVTTSAGVANSALHVSRGDDDAVTTFVLEHQHRLYTYILSIVRDPADAEEVAQDAFVRAIKALRTQYVPEQVEHLVVRPWLYRIARNLALNRIRARKARPLTTPLDEKIEIAAEDAPIALAGDDENWVARAMDGLDPSAREWLMLRFVQELSFSEIASIKGGSESAARGKVFRAVAQLRQRCSEVAHVDL